MVQHERGGAVKPHIRRWRASFGWRWECYNRVGSFLGKTPQEAYGLWLDSAMAYGWSRRELGIE